MYEPYGYLVPGGYIGYIGPKKTLYPTEGEYREIINELNEKEEN